MVYIHGVRLEFQEDNFLFLMGMADYSIQVPQCEFLRHEDVGVDVSWYKNCSYVFIMRLNGLSVNQVDKS